jgi:hypothetical protein
MEKVQKPSTSEHKEITWKLSTSEFVYRQMECDDELQKARI